MNTAVDALVGLLDLERLEENLFRGRSRPIVGERVFGGQVLGQALVAAGRTVAPEREAHSLHAYFLRAGDASQPIIYDVERARDGGSFSTRRIVAIQHGRPIFNMSVSFQIREPGLAHQDPAPEVPPPDELASEWDLLDRLRDRLPKRFRILLEQPQPVEIRPVAPEDPLEPAPTGPSRSAWIRVTGSLPDDPLTHKAVLAFASDFRLLATALGPHGRSMYQGTTQMASLDHAMWLHREVRLDDWLLYHMDTPSASNARGFARGSIHDRQGALVASVAQEGLIRPRDSATGPSDQY